ncbi:Cellulose synthase [Corchorus olitorius]|uniref:Cellulose synthase n=1 Tax=Corchorus olitorius TaxID=93759 RepID=A0A1R3G240_9ROSI|nr:Cellulose synthase [Corchorus olitorius]
MALDYLPEKLHVYLSDDGGSNIDLHGMEVWKFARAWLPICRRSDIESSCPKVYFSKIMTMATSITAINSRQRGKRLSSDCILTAFVCKHNIFIWMITSVPNCLDCFVAVNAQSLLSCFILVECF